MKAERQKIKSPDGQRAGMVGDAQISISQQLSLSGAVIVSTPQVGFLISP